MRNIKTYFSREFKIPLIAAIGIVSFLILEVLRYQTVSNIVILIVIALGSYGLIKETIASFLRGQFAVDYIAIAAIIVGVITKQYLVSAILALMISGGHALEDYGMSQAKKSLTQLVNRIPNKIMVWKNEKESREKAVKNIQSGEIIFVRKGEVIPLDGELLSETGETDESSLTGEPYFITKSKGDLIRMGTVNVGNPILVKVTKEEKNSAYTKIIEMVRRAQEEKSPMVRLADKYSVIFTVITFVIAGFAFLYSFQLVRVLAVLAVATPCPLIIATPIALLGGVNASAKRKIIIKKIAALESLARVKTIVFDKTGTITIGIPRVSGILIKDKSFSKEKVIDITQALERNSLHPLAKAIVGYANRTQNTTLRAADSQEIIGAGISGTVLGKKFLLLRQKTGEGMHIDLLHNKKTIAVFSFEEEIKSNSKIIIKNLKHKGIDLYIFTGDKKESSRKILDKLGEGINLRSEMSPGDKQEGIRELKKKNIIAMIGDGINDAPAIALADVGIAFASDEQTAASDAADIVFLGGDFSMISDALRIAQRAIGIAKQSIVAGIGVSIAAMILATIGIIHPLEGAVFQEAIDIAVIINALRSSRISAS